MKLAAPGQVHAGRASGRYQRRPVAIQASLLRRVHPLPGCRCARVCSCWTVLSSINAYISIPPSLSCLRDAQLSPTAHRDVYVLVVLVVLFVVAASVEHFGLEIGVLGLPPVLYLLARPQAAFGIH